MGDLLESKLRGWNKKKVEYRLRKGGGLEKSIARWDGGVNKIQRRWLFLIFE